MSETKNAARRVAAAALAIACAASGAAFALSQQSGEDAHVGTLVALEESFATAAREEGTKAAFLEYLAEDGVLFRPHPVPGRAWWEAAPEDPGLLQWYPSRAALAESADLGYTLGPWSYGKRNARPRSFGHYLTVWQRQENGDWRVAIDAGISHPKRSSAARLSAGVSMAEPNGQRRLRLDVAALEQRFVQAARASGYEAAAAVWARPRSVRMRDGTEPGAFGGAIGARNGPPASISIEGSAASAAADLAYAYGSVIEEGGARAAFLHVWRVLDGEPYLAVDLFTRLPEEG